MYFNRITLTEIYSFNNKFVYVLIMMTRSSLIPDIHLEIQSKCNHLPDVLNVMSYSLYFHDLHFALVLKF